MARIFKKEFNLLLYKTASFYLLHETQEYIQKKKQKKKKLETKIHANTCNVWMRIVSQ